MKRRRPQDNPRALFERKQDWDDFAESMRQLRDPSIPMLARENLLRIGEAIEARQRPAAERRGWV